jgi:hypothetical protein
MVDLSALQSKIAGKVLTPGDEGFDESLVRWAVNAQKKAALVVYVTSATDVAATVFGSQPNSL